MPVLKNNNYIDDDDATRGDRLLLMQTNIDLHAVELSIPVVLVNWAHTCSDGWVDVCAGAEMESGQRDEAYQEYQKKFRECRAYYQDVKDLLMAIIHDFENPDEAEEAYGIRGRTPRSRHALGAAIEQWADQHAVFSGEGDPRVVPLALITNMSSLATEMNSLWTQASIEDRETSAAYRIKEELFSEDTDRLRVIYNIAKLIWGDDDEKLKDLGFVPSSEVWTPGDDEVEWDDVPTGVNLRIIDLITNQFISIDADKYKGNTGFDVRVAWGETGGNIPKMPKDDTFTNAPFAIAYMDDYKPGMTFYAWVRARKDDEVTDWADVVSLDIPSA